ncbi:hypothetical protein QE152_g1035 [Popillia japonica]|uniref:Uncharacterized protein n=1 Tax=Popillia japonica TaxID=7064 RepID=A0AAW1NCI9_POPJA
MTFMDLIRITDKTHELPQQLQRWGWIPTEGNYKCPTCGNSLRLDSSQDSIDGWVWKCYRNITFRKQARYAGPNLDVESTIRGIVLKASGFLVGSSEAPDGFLWYQWSNEAQAPSSPSSSSGSNLGQPSYPPTGRHMMCCTKRDDQVRHGLARLDLACPAQTRSGLVRPGLG